MGKAIKPDMVAEKLATGKYDTLAVCHNETSTGVRNPIAEIGKMVKKEFPDVIFAVDAVSIYGRRQNQTPRPQLRHRLWQHTEMLRTSTRPRSRLSRRPRNRTRQNRPEQRRIHRPSRHL